MQCKAGIAVSAPKLRRDHYIEPMRDHSAKSMPRREIAISQPTRGFATSPRGQRADRKLVLRSAAWLGASHTSCCQILAGQAPKSCQLLASETKALGNIGGHAPRPNHILQDFIQCRKPDDFASAGFLLSICLSAATWQPMKLKDKCTNAAECVQK